MQKNGVRVKQLETCPYLLEIDEFYMTMFNICGQDVPNIVAYCDLHGLDDEEKIQSVHIVLAISAEVNNASS